jgi:hypothetical protein
MGILNAPFNGSFSIALLRQNSTNRVMNTYGWYKIFFRNHGSYRKYVRGYEEVMNTSPVQKEYLTQHNPYQSSEE